MTKAEIIEYLYDNNVRGDITIEQIAEDLSDCKDEPLTKCDLCRREGDDICLDCERKKRSGKE